MNASAESRAVEALIAHVGTLRAILASRALSFPEESQEFDWWWTRVAEVEKVRSKLKSVLRVILKRDGA